MSLRINSIYGNNNAAGKEDANKMAAKTKALATKRPALRSLANIPVPRQVAAAKKEVPVPAARKTVVHRSNSARLVSAAPVAKKNVPDKLVTCEEEDMETDVVQLTEAFSSQMLDIKDVKDIDKDDSENQFLVGIYINEIYDYLRELETRDCVKPNFLMAPVTSRMRRMLVEWLIAVAGKFKLLQETLFLTVDILDRFLQVQTVTKNELQLVGMTSMFVASKYEEMYCTPIEDLYEICDKTYTPSQIRAMEVKLLKTLNFNLGRPLPLHFLRRNSKAAEVDGRTHTMAKYFIELCLMEYTMAHFKPSIIAGAALCLSIKLLDKQLTWNPTVVYHSKYTETQLLPIMQKMAKIVQKCETSQTHVVRDKYLHSKFMKISSHPQLKSDELKRIANGTE